MPFDSPSMDFMRQWAAHTSQLLWSGSFTNGFTTVRRKALISVNNWEWRLSVAVQYGRRRPRYRSARLFDWQYAASKRTCALRGSNPLNITTHPSAQCRSNCLSVSPCVHILTAACVTSRSWTGRKSATVGQSRQSTTVRITLTIALALALALTNPSTSPSPFPADGPFLSSPHAHDHDYTHDHADSHDYAHTRQSHGRQHDGRRRRRQRGAMGGWHPGVTQPCG